jgi:nucleotide-binding universal stress UspA family protein
MRTIIVLVNFGANAANAARYAADIAFITGAEMRLVHVVSLPSSFVQHPMPNYPLKELHDSAYLLLNKLRTEVSNRTGGKVRISIDLETGKMEHVMKSYCIQYQPFLVVMGAAESGPDLRYGSDDAIDAMKRLPYPLLVVPKNAAFYGAPKVAIACDDKDIEARLELLLPFLKELGESLGTRFQVIHVVTDGESFGEVLQKYDILQGKLGDAGPAMNVVRRKSIEEGINDYLQHHRADWLLVLPKKHNLFTFHKSRAREIALNCPVPVLWLHE